jgi:hypothetical protein
VDDASDEPSEKKPEHFVCHADEFRHTSSKTSRTLGHHRNQPWYIVPASPRTEASWEELCVVDRRDLARALRSFRTIGYSLTTAPCLEWQALSLTVAFLPRIPALQESCYTFPEVSERAWSQSYEAAHTLFASRPASNGRSGAQVSRDTGPSCSEAVCCRRAPGGELDQRSRSVAQTWDWRLPWNDIYLKCSSHCGRYTPTYSANDNAVFRLMDLQEVDNT